VVAFGENLKSFLSLPVFIFVWNKFKVENVKRVSFGEKYFYFIKNIFFLPLLSNGKISNKKLPLSRFG
jgi:hypothetical protein